jgi:hypothetical protein
VIGVEPCRSNHADESAPVGDLAGEGDLEGALTEP